MLQASGNVLLPEFLPEIVWSGAPAAPTSPPAENATNDLPGLIDAMLDSGETNIYDKVIAAVELLLFAPALARTRGHQGQASDLLGLNRTTVLRKLRTLGLSIDKTVQEGQG